MHLHLLPSPQICPNQELWNSKLRKTIFPAPHFLSLEESNESWHSTTSLMKAFHHFSKVNVVYLGLQGLVRVYPYLLVLSLPFYFIWNIQNTDNDPAAAVKWRTDLNPNQTDKICRLLILAIESNLQTFSLALPFSICISLRLINFSGFILVELAKHAYLRVRSFPNRYRQRPGKKSR